MKKRKCFSRYQRVLIAAILILTLIISMKFGLSSQLYGLKKELEREYGSSIDLDGIMNDKFVGCGGKFTGYGHQFAVLEDAVLKPGDDKFYIPCQSKTVPDYWFDYGKEGTHLNSWMNNIVTYEAKSDVIKDLESSKQPVGVVMMRYEYANLYHTMTDWFNVFMVLKLLNVSFSDVSVVWVTTHAKGHLDETWKTLFGEIILKPSLKRPVLFKKMIWNVIGYESPINHHGLSTLPFVDNFHLFFLQQHGFAGTKKLDCNRVNIMFVWRRNYIAHPNNPSGSVSRKVKNEHDLLHYFSEKYPTAFVSSQQLDVLNFTEQLRLISQTDILIAMHGAGLSHVLFLPKHAGVVELYPQYWTKFGMTHFKAMARWRGLKYDSWQNLNPSNEHEDFKTYIPPPSLEQKLNGIYQQLCP